MYKTDNRLNIRIQHCSCVLSEMFGFLETWLRHTKKGENVQKKPQLIEMVSECPQVLGLADKDFKNSYCDLLYKKKRFILAF